MTATKKRVTLKLVKHIVNTYFKRRRGHPTSRGTGKLDARLNELVDQRFIETSSITVVSRYLIPRWYRYRGSNFRFRTTLTLNHCSAGYGGITQSMRITTWLGRVSDCNNVLLTNTGHKLITWRPARCYYTHNQEYMYEGRSINKLQNGVILLVFHQILKIWNIRFVGNLFLVTTCEFYYDDVTVTSFIHNKFGDVATKLVP